jgi:hypothetical protein
VGEDVPARLRPSLRLLSSPLKFQFSERATFARAITRSGAQGATT